MAQVNSTALAAVKAKEAPTVVDGRIGKKIERAECGERGKGLGKLKPKAKTCQYTGTGRELRKEKCTFPIYGPHDANERISQGLENRKSTKMMV